MVPSIYWYSFTILVVVVISIFSVFKINRQKKPTEFKFRRKKRPLFVRWLDFGYRFLTSFGFVKLCFRRMIIYAKMYIFPHLYATNGRKAPEASLVDFEGKHLSLRFDIFSSYRDTPIILNIGSYS